MDKVWNGIFVELRAKREEGGGGTQASFLLNEWAKAHDNENGRLCDFDTIKWFGPELWLCVTYLRDFSLFRHLCSSNVHRQYCMWTASAFALENSLAIPCVFISYTIWRNISCYVYRYSQWIFILKHIVPHSIRVRAEERERERNASAFVSIYTVDKFTVKVQVNPCMKQII